jgi:hypothetical protein
MGFNRISFSGKFCPTLIAHQFPAFGEHCRCRDLVYHLAHSFAISHLVVFTNTSSSEMKSLPFTIGNTPAKCQCHNDIIFYLKVWHLISYFAKQLFSAFVDTNFKRCFFPHFSENEHNIP